MVAERSSIVDERLYLDNIDLENQDYLLIDDDCPLINPWSTQVALAVFFIFSVRTLVFCGDIAGSLFKLDEEDKWAYSMDSPSYWLLINLFNLLTCINIPFQIYNHCYDRSIKYPNYMVPYIARYNNLYATGNILTQPRLIPIWNFFFPFIETCPHTDWSSKVRMVNWALIWTEYIHIFDYPLARQFYAGLLNIDKKYVDYCFMLAIPASALIDSGLIRTVRARERQAGLVRWYHKYCSDEYGPTCLFATPRQFKNQETEEQDAFISYIEACSVGRQRLRLI